jgi:carboxypeptidase Taq
VSNTADQLTTLRDRLALVADLNASAALLEWDQETYMPPAGGEARAQQLATLKTLAHEHFTDDATGSLLDGLDGEVEDDTDRALVHVARRDFDRATKLSADFVARFTRAKARAMEAWKEARADNDFAHFAPHLQEIVDLSLEQAETVGYEDRRYDALLDEYEPGMTWAEVDAVFRDLRAALVPIVAAIADADAPPNAFLHQPYDEDRQWAFGLDVIRAFGYDLDRGRQDRSAHPFSTSFAVTDCRITTRIAERFFSAGFFGTLHEAGHALYEQGVDPALARTPLASGTSLGMHESQSRLWENLVGRSRTFWRWAYPTLQSTFPGPLGKVAEDDFYRAVNRVEPSPIRVEADEVTYNLHIMLRFDIEAQLIDGSLKVDDVPDAWNAGMEDLLGFAPASDADGCLQDIHWSLGALGYFPTYSLGNLMSVQLFDAAERDLGPQGERFERGEFGPLLGWLREHVHRFGRARSADRILRDTTGESLRAEPWLDYVRAKFSAVYSIEL